MPVSICPRCKHVNPEYAIYCHFDGVVLQAPQNAAVLRLPNEFTFPSGRRCKTFDDLAQGCQEEWSAARDLLKRGIFAQYFQKCNRADLVRAANDAKAVANPDIGLTTFLTSLPGTRTQTPKVDLNPRRILLGNLLIGEVKTVPLTITNQGQGMLQGTVSVTEGQDWLSLSDKATTHEIEVATVREQAIPVTINTKGQAAGQTYGAMLTVVTNGGVVEVPLRMDLIAQPFAKPPFQGVRSQRELAEKMRLQPKQAVPVLESGDVQRWFALNGWTYPVRGQQVKGVGGVQQFFEGMGVSKSPAVQLSKTELRFTCKYKDTSRGQVTLQTSAKKWVYGQITSDRPWLKVSQTQVSGPQHATIFFEIDTSLGNLGPTGEGTLTVEANGGQKLALKVAVEVLGAPAMPQPKPVTPAPLTPGPSPRGRGEETPAPIVPHAPPASFKQPATGGGKFVPALVTTVLLCLAFRVCLVPFVDWLGTSSVVFAAATKLGFEPTKDSPINAEFGGWLQLPWLSILAGSDEKLSVKVFQPGNPVEIGMADFRHYFVSYFIRRFVLLTAWLGAIAGVVLILRRGGGTLDVPWGIIAGFGAGFAVSATLAAFFLVVEILPHALWQLAVGPHGGIGYLLLWTVLAVFCWTLVGIALGFVLPSITPLRRAIINPFQRLIATTFKTVGMKTLGDYWTPTD